MENNISVDNMNTENKPADNHKFAKTISLLICILILAIVYNHLYELQNQQKQANAISQCENEAAGICSGYGINDAEISITNSEGKHGRKELLLSVTGTNVDMKAADIYQFVKEIDSIKLNYSKLANQITLNNHVYKLDEENEKILKQDGTVVYIYVTEYEQEIRRGLPFVGMREEYVEKTALGKADSVEKCLDFEHLKTQRKFKTYEWKNIGVYEHYIVTVEYAMRRSRKYGDYETLPDYNGYVDRIEYEKIDGTSETIWFYDTLEE